MPNRDPYAAMADHCDPDNAHLAPAAITRCTLCDDAGYRPNGIICDHVNRAHVGQAQKAHIREMLAKGKR